MPEWIVNPDGISITGPDGHVYVAGDEITRPDGTIIMVKSDYVGITDEDLRKYVPDARSWNGVIVASLNIKGDKGDPSTEPPSQEQVNTAIEALPTNVLAKADFITNGSIVRVNWKDNMIEEISIVDGEEPDTRRIRLKLNEEVTIESNDFPLGRGENGLTVTDVSIVQDSDNTIHFVVTLSDNSTLETNQITLPRGIQGEPGENATQEQVNQAINNADTLPFNDDDFYVDENESIRMKLNGKLAFQKNEAGRYSFTGNDFLIMAGRQIASLANPTEALDATNKQYVDNQITSVHDYVDSSIQLMTDFFQAQITQIHDAVYSQYMAFDINSNQRWTFADYDTGYWYMFYITVRLTGNRLVTGVVEVPGNTIANTEVCNVISDTVSGSSNNLRFLNGQVWVDNWNGDPIYITTIRIMRRKEL